MSLTLALFLFYFVRTIEPGTLSMRKYLFKQTCIRILKTKIYWWKISTLFCLLSGHQAQCSIPRFLSKLVLRVSLALSYAEPMFPFGISWKHKKTLRFSDFFTGSQKGTLAKYGLSLIFFFFQSFEKLVLSDVLF